jgi:hypothetical protein
MNSAVDLSATTTEVITSREIQRPRTAGYFWIALLFVGLAMIGFGVAGSYYVNTDITDAPYVGP